ncbi:MAG: efflux RND transporter periplasmic adaptor subunit [Alphaproteobacteria bacterium]|nr:MAG: efflux RND transporter periplasmic adaptor subunit [Alphaproteobacteria bacterium]
MLDASGGKNKTVPFGRKSEGRAQRKAPAGKTRALFVACALFGAVLGLMLVLSDPLLFNKEDWRRAPALAGQQLQAFGAFAGELGRETADKAGKLRKQTVQKLADVKLPDLTTLKQQAVIAYAPFIQTASHTITAVSRDIRAFEQKTVEFAAARKLFFSVSSREKTPLQLASLKEEKKQEPPIADEADPMRKVLEDIESFAQIAPAAGDNPVETAAVETLPPVVEAPVETHEVQSVLIARRQAVISSLMSGRILDFPFQNGDVFSAEDILARFDCALEEALYSEKSAALRLADAELKAKKQLRKLGTLSEIEYIAAQESVAQEQARLAQVEKRIALCTIKAPFDGRVTNRLASPYEYAERGRVLMEISSNEPLLLQFLVPSVWLRWLNVGTPFDVYVEESGKTYPAKVIRVHGKVDPVSQTAEIVAELSSYQEELLPGMGGKAIFDVGAARKKIPLGFIGLKVAANPEEAPQDSSDE